MPLSPIAMWEHCCLGTPLEALAVGVDRLGTRDAQARDGAVAVVDQRVLDSCCGLVYSI